MIGTTLCLLLALVASTHALPAACDSVELVTREQWCAREPVERVLMPTPVNMHFIHHTAMSRCNTLESCSAEMRLIQNGHMDSNGWSDIGYSFLVGEDGRIYEGRGWGVVGAHTQHYNDIAHAISFFGDFSDFLPDQIAIDAAEQWIVCGKENYWITWDYEIFGHRDAKCTLCPGDTLYALLQTHPNFYDTDIPYYC